MSLLGYYARNAGLLYLWPIGRGHSGSRHPAVILPKTETYHLDHLARPLFLSQQTGRGVRSSYPCWPSRVEACHAAKRGGQPDVLFDATNLSSVTFVPR